MEDKIIAKSRQAGKHFQDYTKEYRKFFFDDLAALNIETCERHPNATDPEVMDKMAEMIENLLDRGIAYKSADGSTYFNIRKFPDYGKLACINVDDLQAGARVAQDEYDKETAADFALWKAWTEADGDVYWDQYPKLGKGRPGWHIECSAMALMHLGAHFDMHLGGVDLVFPHHQNEIAQSESFNQEKFVNTWVHVEHLYVESQKMSKSLGNFYTLRNLMNEDENSSGKAWDPMAIRLSLLKVPYGSRLNFTFTELAASASAIERLAGYLRRCGEQSGSGGEDEAVKAVEKARAGFIAEMDDNLNTTAALAHLFDFLTETNPLLEKGVSAQAGKTLSDFILELDQVLGLKLDRFTQAEDLDSEIQKLVDQRVQARKDRDWALADSLRQQLTEMGIALEDTPDGVRWKKIAP